MTDPSQVLADVAAILDAESERAAEEHRDELHHEIKEVHRALSGLLVVAGNMPVDEYAAELVRNVCCDLAETITVLARGLSQR